MTGSTGQPMIERSSRYIIRDGRNATVVLQSVSDSARPPLRASLIDLSETGAKLSAAGCGPIGESVRLKLAIEHHDSEFSSEAEVCWCRHDQGDDWLVVCAFRPQMPEHVLDAFVDSGLLERRDSERRSVSLPITIRRELDGAAESARLHDYSDGGFCIATSHPVEVGRRLSMECEAADGSQLEVWAQVRWTLRTEGLNRAGCSILRGRDYGLLRALEG